MTEHKPHSNPDAEIVLAWITRGSHKGGHHPRCATGHDNGCDCYARATEPARAALGRLIEQLEALQAEAREINGLLDVGHDYDVMLFNQILEWWQRPGGVREMFDDGFRQAQEAKRGSNPASGTPGGSGVGQSVSTRPEQSLSEPVTDSDAASSPASGQEGS